ncbi:hypothetical protein HK405_015858, partial [Cladochytrium tenue]
MQCLDTAATGPAGAGAGAASVTSVLLAVGPKRPAAAAAAAQPGAPPPMAPALRAHIAAAYSESPDAYKADLAELDTLRADLAYLDDPHPALLARLLTLLSHLDAVALRFPVDEDHVRICFTWSNAAAPPTSSSAVAAIAAAASAFAGLGLGTGAPTAAAGASTPGRGGGPLVFSSSFGL